MWSAPSIDVHTIIQQSLLVNKLKNNMALLSFLPFFHFFISAVVGWCDGPGYTFIAGASYNLDDSREGPIALALGADGG